MIPQIILLVILLFGLWHSEPGEFRMNLRAVLLILILLTWGGFFAHIFHALGGR